MNKLNEQTHQIGGTLTPGKHIKHLTSLPHMGQRIVKTAAAVFFCLVIYILRGYHGMVSQSTIAAIICLQPFREDEKVVAFNRIIGTLIGAAWGLLFLLLMRIAPFLSVHMLVVYLVMSVGVALTLYCSVVLKKSAAAGLAAIVFLCVVLGYPDLEQPLLQTLDRVMDTLIGILVAFGVNSLHLPREKHPEYVFFVRLQDLVPDRFTNVSSNVLVMLNRLSGEGANLCLVSKWAPAFLLSQMGLVKLRLPVIVMDGAAIYDIDSGSYLDITAIAPERVRLLCGLLEEMELGYQIYAVRERTMEIYRRGHSNWAEEHEFQLMKRSPYRNYLDGHCTEEDCVTFIRVIDSDVRMDLLEARLRSRVPEGLFRIVRRKQPRMEGYSGLYFYAPDATVENRKKTLLTYAAQRCQMEEKSIVPFDVAPLWSNYAPERDAVSLLTRVRSVYSPVRLRKLFRRRHKTESFH